MLSAESSFSSQDRPLVATASSPVSSSASIDHTAPPSPAPSTPPPVSDDKVESLPPSVASILQVLQRLYSSAPTALTDEPEVYELEISPQECTQLWSLLGTRKEGDAEAQGALPTAQGGRLRNIAKSAEHLHELGRWFEDSVRYDVFSQVDAAGNTSTRFWIRMPSVIHDQVANETGELFRDALKSVLGGTKVTALSMKCDFSDKFHRLVAEERRALKAAEAKQRETQQAAAAASQAAASEPGESTALQSQPQRQVLSMGSTAGPTADTPSPAGPAEQVDADVRRELEQEQQRYETAQPDVCIFIGSTARNLFPAIIIEVGFSHPLPFDRARSYICGSEGSCRVVITLDLDYRDKKDRLQLYQGMDEQQRLREEVPPYSLELNLFRCKNIAGAAGSRDAYTAKHELRHIDVREFARLGKVLELDRDDLFDNEETMVIGKGAPAVTIPEGNIGISYADLVRIVDDAAWSQAVRDNPSLQLPKKRKRDAKLPSPSPDPDGAGSSASSGRRLVRSFSRVSKRQRQ